ncbi:MAG: hypothetical protein IT563_03930 [Alphaproteobacteria bacterium]|nr:hypothetical protein [Alphaproteobacteria bacterium]
MAVACSSALDGAPARVAAALVAVAALGLLGYIHREDLTGLARVASGDAAKPAAADDPFARCMAEHGQKVDKMVKDGMIQPALAETFKSRAEGLCRAGAAGATKAQ